MKTVTVVVLLLGLVSVHPTRGFRSLPATEVDTGNFGCPTDDSEQIVTDSNDAVIRSDVQANILSTITCRLGECESNPASSCQEVLEQGPGVDGWYWLRRCDGAHVQMYCAMTNPCSCSGGGAWMRVGLLNMTDTSSSCPSGMELRTVQGRRMCSRQVNPAQCVSVFHSAQFLQYNRVCGRLYGYQDGNPDAFRPYFDNRAYTIDDPFIDGATLTHGFSPRKHVWSFGAAPDDVNSSPYHCPCSTGSAFTGAVPPFVGNDWFCEAGALTSAGDTVWVSNPLWDGMGCASASSCCTFNSPPWFCKDLPSTTRDDLELRMCGDEHVGNEDVPIYYYEIYVQ